MSPTGIEIQNVVIEALSDVGLKIALDAGGHVLEHITVEDVELMFPERGFGALAKQDKGNGAA